jgi:hypothetical protein
MRGRALTACPKTFSPRPGHREAVAGRGAGGEGFGYAEQVVDVFYVTDQQGRKVEDPSWLEEIQRRLLKVIESLEEE